MVNTGCRQNFSSMARPITIKNIKQVHICTCGKNTIEDYQQKIRHKDLIGAKRKKYQNTGERFFLILFESKECHCYDE